MGEQAECVEEEGGGGVGVAASEDDMSEASSQSQVSCAILSWEHR